MKEKILFNGISINEIFHENNKRIMDVIARIDCDRLLNTDVKELTEEVYQKNKIKNISVDIARMRILEHDNSRIKVGIPVEEGGSMLEVSPTDQYGSVHPVGALEDGYVTKMFPIPDENNERTKKQISIWRDVLDLFSNNLDEDIVHYHKHLLKDIEDWIVRFRERCPKKEKRLKDLSNELGMN